MTSINAQTAKDFAEAWDKNHISKIQPSNVRHADLKKYLEALKKLDTKVEEVGRSFANREIYQMEWGKGATKVFMWSQMHGDEPTATSALIDLFAFLQKNRDKKWVKNLEEKLTIRAIPMLNPDGTEMYNRRNYQYIDINRDAIGLKSPEAALLKRLRDEWLPHIGFNLHNQQELTTVGRTDKQAAISFLAVSGNAENVTNDGHERNKRLISMMLFNLNQFIPGHIGRYTDAFTPTAFGDTFSAAGTPTILIETGAFHGQDELYLVKMNFIAFLTALNGLADGSEAKVNPSFYDAIPANSSGRIYNVIFRNASVVNAPESVFPYSSDVGLKGERRREQHLTSMFIREIGDLTNYVGLDEYDASSFYLAPGWEKIRVGGRGEFLFYKKSRQIDWTVENLREAFPPDAIFSLGKWVKGEKVLPKIK